MKTIKQFLTLVHADPAKEQELLHYLQTDDQTNIIRMASSMGVTLTLHELSNRIESPGESVSRIQPEKQLFDFWHFLKNMGQ